MMVAVVIPLNLSAGAGVGARSFLKYISEPRRALLAMSYTKRLFLSLALTLSFSFFP